MTSRTTLVGSSTSSQALDTSALVNPAGCDGAIYPAEVPVYGSVGVTALRQSLVQSQESAPYRIVDQAVALLSSPEAAQQLQADSKDQWDACTNQPVTIANPDGTATVATLPGVVSRDNLIGQNREVTTADRPGTQRDPSVDPTKVACQHSMGVWSNVVAETVVCGDGDIGDQSQEIVNQILAAAQERG